MQKQKPRVSYSVALVLAFLEADNENRKLEDLALAHFGRLPKRLLLSVRTKSVKGIFSEITTIVFVIMIQHVFSSLTHSIVVNWGLSIHLFSFINEVGFSCQ